ncbi:MAG: hypothetical protein H0W89_03565 [Candidatus Levybacteria bacterium]|nr:hypothetical protein [Candidatus Levybacteria bacterium]
MANIQNLKPFSGADDPRRHNGRPKGAKNLKTIIRELENENFNWDLVPIKNKAAAKAIGSPLKVIVYVAIAKAISGDISAMYWLSRTGYGRKTEIEPDILPQVIEPRVIR